MSRGPDKSFSEAEVLENAMHLFWRHGFSATPVSLLREVTGLGAKSLYDTFGSKGDLFISCIDHYGETIVKALFDDVAAKHPPARALIVMLENLSHITSHKPSPGCLLGVASADRESNPKIDGAINKQLDRMHKVLVQAINACIKDGSLAETTDAKDLASLLVSIIMGVNMISRVEDKAKHSKQASKAAIALLESQFLESGGSE